MNHFHFDLFGNYIPGLCSGLAIHCDDLGHRISPEKYPILHTLYQEGIKGFYDCVTSEYRFESSEGYISKCNLCFDLRRYLVVSKGMNSRELQPKGIYENYESERA